VNKLSSILGPILVIAIAVVFIVQFQAVKPGGATKTDSLTCAYYVHDSCVVPAGSFKAAYSLIASTADPGKLRSMGMGRKVADGLLESWVLNQDAKRLGISVSEDDLSAELVAGRAHVSLPASDIHALGYSFQLGDDLIRYLPVKNAKTKHFEKKVYEKAVRQQTKLSPEDFRALQKSELVAARMRDLIRSRVRISEAEAFDQFSRDKSTATLDYVRFDRRFYADVAVDTSAKTIDAWAEQHKDEIDKVWESRKAQVMPECRSVREIWVRLDEAPSDEEKAKAKARIDRARERILKGEDFGDVARGMSDDASAVRGGEIGCLLKGKAPKPLEDAVNALAAGKVSEPVVTDGGLYLVKVEQIAKGDDAEKLGRAQSAKELYVGMEAERLAVEGAKNVLAAVKGGKSLKDALDLHLAELAKAHDTLAGDAGKKGKKKDDKAKADKTTAPADEDRAPVTAANHPSRPTVETTLPFNVSGDPIPGMRSGSELVKSAFNMVKPGEVAGDTFPFDNGYVAVQLKEKTPATKEQWEKDREHYSASMRAFKANDALIAYVKRLQASLAGDAKFTKELVEEKARPAGDGPAPPADDDSGE
jgi:peptidyl-prolyl cis-trans isomerase D